jgi:hypothetical protein
MYFDRGEFEQMHDGERNRTASTTSDYWDRRRPEPLGRAVLVRRSACAKRRERAPASEGGARGKKPLRKSIFL